MTRRTCLPLLVGGLVTLAAAPALAQTPPSPEGVLMLNAAATQEVDHDVMQITFSTQRDGPDAQAVQSALKQALDAALAEARKAARPRELEVETGNFSLYPRYSSKGQPSGWQGSAELRVHGRDLPGIAQLSGRITTLSIARVSYSLSPERRQEVERGVAERAVARFRTQALEYAKLFGYADVAVREVSVGSNEPPVLEHAFKGRVAMASAADESLPVEPGKGSVSVTVNGSVQMLK